MRVRDRVTPSEKLARPTVAPTTQGDQVPAANVESSKRNPRTLSPSTLNAGTRR